MVVYAFAYRRRVAVHASAMLATALLVLPPIIGRVVLAIPGFPTGGAAGFGWFRLAFDLANLLTLLVAIALAARRQTAGVGFAFAAAATAAQVVAFETIGGTAIWGRVVALLTDMHPEPVAALAAMVTTALLWWAWRVVPPRAGARREREPAGDL